jgi:hypothetical protein
MQFVNQLLTGQIINGVDLPESPNEKKKKDWVNKKEKIFFLFLSGS